MIQAMCICGNMLGVDSPVETNTLSQFSNILCSIKRIKGRTLRLSYTQILLVE